MPPARASSKAGRLAELTPRSGASHQRRCGWALDFSGKRLILLGNLGQANVSSFPDDFAHSVPAGLLYVVVCGRISSSSYYCKPVPGTLLDLSLSELTLEYGVGDGGRNV